MVTTRPPKTIVKPTALGPVANTDAKLLIYGLFQKGRVLAQDGVGQLAFRQLDSNGTARVGGGHRGVTEIVRSLESTLMKIRVPTLGVRLRAVPQTHHQASAMVTGLDQASSPSQILQRPRVSMVQGVADAPTEPVVLQASFHAVSDLRQPA